MTASSVRKIARDEMLKDDNKTLHTIISGTATSALTTSLPMIRLVFTEEKSKIAIGTQDPTAGDRVGNSITLKSSQLKFRLQKAAAASFGANTFRILIIKWSGNSIPNSDEILLDRLVPAVTNTTQMDLAPYLGKTDGDVEWANNYTILYDRQHTVSTGLSELIHLRTISLPVKGHKIIYDNTSTLESSGGLYLLIYGSDSANLGAWSCDVKTRYAV